jgi:hypothetical protein
MHNPSDLLLWGIVAHFVADWLLQNEWMSVNKVKWNHPAALTHSLIHFGVMCFVFPVQWSLAIAATHWWIDTRVPLQWWRRFYHQTSDPSNPAFLPFTMWQDQVVHITIIALVSLLAR